MLVPQFLIVILSIFSIASVIQSPVLASSETYVNVKTNGSSANSDVSVTNNAKTQTDIRIETNGEVQEYHSDTGEDVTIVSEDGNTVVKVNNSGSGQVGLGSQQSQTGPSSTPKPSTPPQSSNTPIPTSLTPKDTASEQQMSQSPDQSLFAVFLHWLINLF